MKYCVNCKLMRRWTLSLLFLSVLLLLGAGRSFGFETKGQDCSKCHTLTSDQAKDLLKEMIPNLTVLEVGTSPVKGFWEVFFESGARKGLIYLDYAKKHFFSGSLISLQDKRNLTQERFNELNKVDLSQIPLDDALVMGEKTAKYKVIAFDDPD
jgi:thiol:disulfide interchange protein DsbC